MRKLFFHAAMVVAVSSAVAGAPNGAAAASDPNALCHKTVVKQLEKFKKTQLKLYRNCLDKQNRNLIAGPCLDVVSQAKLDLTEQKVAAAIAKKCTPAILTALGYRSDCQYDAATPGVGGTCAALPVTTATEFATCMMCWKGAEFARYVGTLYASHATEVCGALDDTSLTCSAVGCTTPLPTQRDLGDNAENDCQRRIAKASLNYLLKREKILDKCLLRGLSYGACLADPKTSLQLAKAEAQKETLILKICRSRIRPGAAGPARVRPARSRPTAPTASTTSWEPSWKDGPARSEPARTCRAPGSRSPGGSTARPTSRVPARRSATSTA
jgi:hypothetical protein